MKPTLFGYGLTTKAIASSLGGGCVFFDDNCQDAYSDDMGNTILPSREFDATKSSLEVTTPSLPPAHPLIQKAKNLKSEYDYFLGSTDKKPFNIWISGTNGKTTTTQMLTHLLSKKGAISGGNIGTPLANLDFDAPIWVLETSSFTLHHTNEASPDIYILLPITPDHLNWHGDMHGYTQDKLKPLTTMREGELALVPKGLDLPPSDAYVVEYDTNEFLAEYFDIDMHRINFKGAFLQDALLSLAVTRVLFDEVDYDLINGFKKDAHRQEEIVDKYDRVWINDSKATNLDATIQAIKGYSDKFIRLIIGGDDKGANLSPLFELLRDKELKLYIIGANSNRLANFANKYNIEFNLSKTLENAVHSISKERDQNDVALLSPAAASYDQFNSYKHRGEEFFKFIKKIK